MLFFASTQTTFGGFYGVLLVYTLCYMPTLALSNSLSFRQMDDPGREFPPIRVLGTIGWIVAGLAIGTLGLEATAKPLQIAGGRVDPARAVLPGAAAHAAAREGDRQARDVARHPRPRRAEAAAASGRSRSSCSARS